MVKIPRMEQSIAADPPPMPNLVGEGWTAPGRAMQTLGQGIASLGAGLSAMQKDNDEEELHRFRVDATNTFNAVDMDDLEREGKYGEGDGVGYRDERVQNFETRSADLSPYLQSPNPRVRRAAEIAVAQRRGVVAERAQRFETYRRREVEFGQAVTTVGSTFSVLNAQAEKMEPDAYDTELTARAQAMNAMIDSYPSIPEEKRNALRAEVAKQFMGSYTAYYGKGRGASEPGVADRIKSLNERLMQFQVPAPAEVGPQSRYGAPVEGAIAEAASATGMDPELLRTFVGIESSGDPSKVTGSYKGLFQLSDEQFAKFGGKGSILDPRENALAAARKLQADATAFQQKYGKSPTAADLYLIHQQGAGGYDAHVSNPNQPAWKSMASTAEGRQKGEGWAKAAIWGNLPEEAKRQYGSVDNVTSKQFVEWWQGRVARGDAGPRVRPGQLAGPAQPLPVTPELVDKDARTVSAAVAGKTPGVVHAVTEQTARTFNPQGYGDKTSGFITVNGRTYQFVNGGSGRGSIPLGEYAITRFTSGGQRAQEGRSFRADAFELSDAKDDAPGTRGQANRQGLLIHDGNNGVTKGCIGIKGDFEQFKRDLMAEQQKNGGRLTLNLAPRPTKTDVATPGPVQGTRVASRTDVATDAAPAGSEASPGQNGGGPTIPKSEPADGAAAASGRETQVAQAGNAAPPQPQVRYRPSVFSEIIEQNNKALPAWAERDRAIMDGKVKSIEERAAKGELPPVEEVQKTIDQLQRYGTKEQQARFAYALEGGRVTQQYLQAPPAVVAETLSNLNALGKERGFTPEMSAHKEALEKLQTKQQEGLNKSMLEWADGVGRVKISQITPQMMAEDGDGGIEAMRVRAAQARGLGTYYEREPQFLTPKERDAFAAEFKKGGANMINLITQISEGFGADAPKVFAEFSKDAPEAAMLGWLVHNKGSTIAIADMSKALEMRLDPKFKSVAPSYEEARRVMQSSDVARGLFTAPRVEERAIQAANLLYEIRARRNGEDGKVVNEELWKEGLMEVLGQTEFDGHTYGGVVKNAGWWSGHPVVIPPNVRQDKFWSVINAVRMEDLMRPGVGQPERPVQLPPVSVTGAELPWQAVEAPAPEPMPAAGPMDAAAQRVQEQVAKGQPALQAVSGAPVDDRGRPVPMSVIRSGTLVSIGDGRYWVAMGDPTDRNAKFVGSLTERDGRFVLDLRKLEGALKARVPDAYR
jgi:hypothetical protein